jgi:hypothetical protein
MRSFEDLIFHPKQLLSIVCECAGAVPKEEAFSYVVGEGKWGKAHERSSNLISAMVRYGSDKNRLASLTTEDLTYAKEHFDPELMSMFQYLQPDVAIGAPHYVPEEESKPDIAPGLIASVTALVVS